MIPCKSAWDYADLSMQTTFYNGQIIKRSSLRTIVLSLLERT